MKGLTGSGEGKGVIDSVKDLAGGSGGEGQSFKDLTGAAFPYTRSMHAWRVVCWAADAGKRLYS